MDGSKAMVPSPNPSDPSPQLNALSSSVSFNGWRFANTKFKLWARKMAALHEPIWRKAGIFEAVVASTYKIFKNIDLVLGVAEKWCPNTKTFVFPWGEATITLEDVMLLSGFSVLGSSVFATLDSSGGKILTKLMNEWWTIKRRAKVTFVTQVAWMERFMDSEDEHEHVAFLVLWLGYFVLPSRFPHLYEAIFPIAIHLSMGTRIALAPAVLAHLYADLTLLKAHIVDFRKSPIRVEKALSALFKLVQVWTWERFRELQPKPNLLQEGEPRLALWNDLKQKTNDARQFLDNSKMDSFVWRPYTKTVTNWKFPKFYPEKAMCVPVCPSLDEEFISFARCIKVAELVGINNVEHYFPNRVASQFGMLQDVPSLVNRNNLSPEEAWNNYNKPINNMELYIPSRSATPRVTPTFCEWWRKTSPEFLNSSTEGVVESAEALNARNIIGDETSIVPSGSKMNCTIKVEMNIVEDSNMRRKCMEQARDKRRKHMIQALEIGSNKTSKDQMKIAEESDKRRKYMDQALEIGSNRTSKDKMKIAEESDKRRKYMDQALEIGSNITSKDEMKTAEESNKRRKYMDQAREIGSNRTIKTEMNIAEDSNKRRKYVMQDRKNDESTMGRFQTHVPSENDEEVDSLTIAQPLTLKYSGEDASEPLGNNDCVPSQKLASIRDETVQPPENEQRNEEADESGSKAGNNMAVIPFDENNSSDLGANEGGLEMVVSSSETRKTCDDELDVYGSNADLIDDGSKEPKGLLQEDGIIAGQKVSSYEKLFSSEAQKDDDVVDDDSLIQKKVAIGELALKADNNESIPCQKLASGGTNGDETCKAYKSKVLNPSDESNIHISVGDDTHGRDCLLHDESLGSEKAMKFNEDLEKRNDCFGEGNAGNESYEKRFQELKVLASSLEERIDMALKTVALLKERKAEKLRKIAAARLT